MEGDFSATGICFNSCAVQGLGMGMQNYPVPGLRALLCHLTVYVILCSFILD